LNISSTSVMLTNKLQERHICFLFLHMESIILTLRQSQTLRAVGVNSLLRLIDMVIDNRLSYTRTTIDFVMSLYWALDWQRTDLVI